MVRRALILLACAALRAQDAAPQSAPPPSEDQLKTQRPAPPDVGPYEVPPEEDKSLTRENYSFNPLQSKKDVMVGNEYFKAGNYKAAAGRFRDATRWNDKNAEAWRRLAETAEKQKDLETVKEAYGKYLKLQPEAKDAPDIRKKLAKLK